MWDSVIGQDEAKSFLDQLIVNQRVGHAYLFYGPYGVGKRAAAFNFARALQCQSEGARPCDVCESCQKGMKSQHPDIHLYFPTPNGVSKEEVARRKIVLSENPYALADFVRMPTNDKSSNKKSAYRVSFIREELARQVSFSIHEGRYRVVILLDVENMNREASNAFLKLLEEPRENTVFILTTQNRSRLLPTLISRCQPLRFPSIRSELLEKVLVEKHSISMENAKQLAVSSFGSYSLAVSSLTESGDDLSDDVLHFVRAAAMLDFDKIDTIGAKWKKMGRESVKGFLERMLFWTRDLNIYREIGDEIGLSYPKYSETYSKFWERFPKADVQEMVLIIEKASGNVDKNISLTLLFANLGILLSDAMKGIGK